MSQEPADIVALEFDVLRGRRWKLSRIEERAFEALQDFLRQKLDYKHYSQRFADDLTEILQSAVPKNRAEDYAPMLARACAQNQSAAVDEVNKILDRMGRSLDYVLNCALTKEVQELTRKYQRHDSAALEFIDQLLAAVH